MQQTVTTIARKLNFSGFGRNFSSFSQTSISFADGDKGILDFNQLGRYIYHDADFIRLYISLPSLIFISGLSTTKVSEGG